MFDRHGAKDNWHSFLRHGVVAVVVKEYQELTPLSRIFARMPYTGPHIFKWADKKIWPPTLTKFSGFVGDIKADVTT